MWAVKFILQPEEGKPIHTFTFEYAMRLLYNIL